ncbi:hypothetical protein YC2023_043122 [Brassica napus]
MFFPLPRPLLILLCQYVKTLVSVFSSQIWDAGNVFCLTVVFFRNGDEVKAVWMWGEATANTIGALEIANVRKSSRTSYTDASIRCTGNQGNEVNATLECLPSSVENVY